ncbi:MAG: non-ribosomal peptide synthetase, partial [Chloroflexota bacterium]
DRDWATVAEQQATNPHNKATPENLAYVIYTSGSTGLPKGVAIEHRSPVAFLSWVQSVFTPADLIGVLASTSICFDLSVFELFAPLTVGGTVILAENALALPTLPSALRVTLINTVPSAIAELLQSNGIPLSIRTINLAGEPLSTALVHEIYDKTSAAKVYDLYGPSEDTTYSTYALRTSQGPQTIGRPITNTQGYILDRRLNPVPAGVIGDLYLGGEGLARGYLNRPDLTAEKFIPDPFGKREGRLYKTGDVARYLPNGNIQFLGRRDNQVKVRGFRIELGEIETILGQYPTVRQAVVVASEEVAGDKQLIAYIVTDREGSFSIDELRSFMKNKLPSYMVPSTFVVLDSLPLTPNGKVDRKALPAPTSSRPDLTEPFVAPRTREEELIANIWAEVLNIKTIGIHDNFFDLGGHSLLAMRVISHVRKTFAMDIAVRTLFEAPTVAGFAAALLLKQSEHAAQQELDSLLTELESLSVEDAQRLLRGKAKS